ncbi:MAG: AbrB/MazE/SpoVT family DNA-binding domain-containing protein [Candidatus Latescibacterota bacterium]|nr:AbrB/MazE/SpoVT family DNA-binding domain-containing protein [Candidatus Latescibacterota bacterium]
MTIATVTSKGQIAIPARIRKNYGIEQGTQL